MDVQESFKRSRETSPDGLQPSVLGSSGSAKRPRVEVGPKWGPTRINTKVLDHVTSMFQKYVYSPSEAVRNSIEWVRSDKVKHVFENPHPEFMGTLDNWETELYNFSYEEFVNFYQIRREYRWRPGARYHSLDDSVKYAEQWLEQICRTGTISIGCDRPSKYPKTVKGN